MIREVFKTISVVFAIVLLTSLTPSALSLQYHDDAMAVAYNIFIVKFSCVSLLILATMKLGAYLLNESETGQSPSPLRG